MVGDILNFFKAASISLTVMLCMKIKIIIHTWVFSIHAHSNISQNSVKENHGARDPKIPELYSKTSESGSLGEEPRNVHFSKLPG